MNAIVQFVIEHGYFILFAVVFAHQIGLPVPAPLFLLAVGALIATRRLGLLPVLVLAVVACVLADCVWYEAGRRKGDKVLHFIHRLTRDPDAHDRRAKRIFARCGPPLLVIAKFVPGLDAVAPPLAGTARTSRPRFLMFDALGAGLYSCAYTGLGYVFSHDLDRAAAYLGRAGKLLAGFGFAGLLVYVCARKLLRWHSLRRVFRGMPSSPPDPAQSDATLPIPTSLLKESTMITKPAAKLTIMCKCVLLTTTVAILALSPICRAQTEQTNLDSAIEVIRAGMQADRVTMITAAMNFNDKEGAAFWPIYREYAHARSILDDSRVVVIKQYTQKYPDFSDADAKTMAERMFDCEARLAELKKTYYKKFNKVLPALTVTKFFQLERRIDLMMDMKVESALPPLAQPQLDNSESGQ